MSRRAVEPGGGASLVATPCAAAGRTCQCTSLRPNPNPNTYTNPLNLTLARTLTFTRLGVPVVCTSIAVSGMHATHGEDVLLADSPDDMAAAVMVAYYNATTWHRLMWGGRKLLASRFSASRAATGVLEVLALLRETNTLMGMKSLAITDARPRIYSDLRAAASLGGYFFNFTRLEGQLEISDQVVPHDRTCETVPAGSRDGFVHETSSHFFPQRVASSTSS